MNLKDTVAGMISDDYKARFKAEYQQARIRYEKLLVLIRRAKDGQLDFDLSCPLELLELQEQAMRGYLIILQERAVVEKIDLGGMLHLELDQ